MVTFRLTQADHDDVWMIVARGGPRILVGQRIFYRPSLGEDPGMFEVYSIDVPYVHFHSKVLYNIRMFIPLKKTAKIRKKPRFWHYK
jgi:hypothetical protein